MRPIPGLQWGTQYEEEKIRGGALACRPNFLSGDSRSRHFLTRSFAVNSLMRDACAAIMRSIGRCESALPFMLARKRNHVCVAIRHLSARRTTTALPDPSLRIFAWRLCTNSCADCQPACKPLQSMWLCKACFNSTRCQASTASDRGPPRHSPVCFPPGWFATGRC